MKIERLLKLIGIAIFFIVTLQTYVIVAPVNNMTNASQDNLTSTTTSTTANAIGDDSIITNIYRTITAIATGGVIAPLAIFFLRPVLIKNLKKNDYSGSNR